MAFVVLNAVLLASWTFLAAERWSAGVTGAFVVAIALTDLLLLRSLLQMRGNTEPRRAASAITRSISARRHSIRDETTGLYQRWYLEQRLAEEAERCRRYKHSMAVVVLRAGLIDLSTWSGDEWQGHAAEVAKRAATAIRSVDLIASVGPLEFAICLVQCDREGAEIAIRRIAAELSGFRCEAGVAVYPGDNCEPAALIELAHGRIEAVDDAEQQRSA
jgi:diguanylate cyclase (GGDEF)-like protein